MPASPIRKLVPLAEAAKARGTKIYHLNIGQPDVPTPQVGLDALRHIDRTVLEYSPSDGYRSLREKLVEYYAQYQIKLSPDEIIVTTGGSEAVLFAFMSCLNPGDEIIVPEPAYANYMAFAISAGAVIRPVVSTIEQGFALPDIAEFERLINERTRGILICNPNNPTGYLYTRKEMDRIRDLVKRYDLFLFSDEVYREFIYTGSPYISACHLEGIEEHVVLIDSLSKRYSECGIRIGALITKNRKLRDAVMKFCQARLSPPLLGQIVAEASIDAPRSYSAEVYEERLLRLVSERLQLRGRDRHDGPRLGLLLRPRLRPQRGAHRLRAEQAGPHARPLPARKGARGLQQPQIAEAPPSPPERRQQVFRQGSHTEVRPLPLSVPLLRRCPAAPMRNAAAPLPHTAAPMRSVCFLLPLLPRLPRPRPVFTLLPSCRSPAAPLSRHNQLRQQPRRSSDPTYRPIFYRLFQFLRLSDQFLWGARIVFLPLPPLLRAPQGPAKY